EVAVAAVLGRELQPDVAELGEPAEHLVREPFRLLPLPRVGKQLVLHETPDRSPELFVLRGERRDRPADARRAGACFLGQAHAQHNRIDRPASGRTPRALLRRSARAAARSDPAAVRLYPAAARSYPAAAR